MAKAETKKAAETMMEGIKKEIVVQVDALMKMYLSDIEKGFLQTDDSFTISFSIKLSGTEPTKVKTDITFVEKKTKDNVEKNVFFSQQDLLAESK